MHLLWCAWIDPCYSIPAFRRGPVCRGQFGEVLSFLRPTVRLSSNAPACRGQSRLSGFCCAHRLCVRSPCQHISRMRTFDNNSCAISITSPRSLFRPRTQHGRWGHREKSRRASTRWDCRGKSCLAGLSPLSGTPSERRVKAFPPRINLPCGVLSTFSSFYLGGLEMSNYIELYIILKLRISSFRICP